MSMSVNSLMSNYTYGYGTGVGVRPKLDKDNDSSWSKSEITNYADAYKSATGKSIDVDKLMTSYDKDGDGKVSFSEQEAVRDDDALNLRTLVPEKATYKSSAASANSSTQETQKSTDEILADLMANMSTASKVSFSSSIFKSEQKTNMFNMFNSANPMQDFANSIGLGSKSGSSTNYSAYMGQMMNMLV